MLEPLLGSADGERVLLFITERGEGYGRQIADFWGCSVTGIQRRLDRLESGGVFALLVHLSEAAIKPVHLRGRGFEVAFIRSGATSRPASRPASIGACPRFMPWQISQVLGLTCFEKTTVNSLFLYEKAVPAALHVANQFSFLDF